MPDNVDAFSPKTLGRLKIAEIVLACIAAFIVVSGAITRLSADKQAETYADQQSVQTVNVIAPVRAGGSNTLTLPGKLEVFTAPRSMRACRVMSVPGTRISAPRCEKVISSPPSTRPNWISSSNRRKRIWQTPWPRRNCHNPPPHAGMVCWRLTRCPNRKPMKRPAIWWPRPHLSMRPRRMSTGSAISKTLRASSRPSMERSQADCRYRRTRQCRRPNVQSALFTVADAHQIRVYVDVPQTYSARDAPGMTATLSLPQYPGQTFPATLDSTANAFSQQSDTLLVELLANNVTGTLKPGEYAQVTFHISSHGNVLRLPASALTFRQQGLQVATVLPDSHVQMKSIVIGRDLGTQVEVSEGLNPQDRIVDNPPNSYFPAMSCAFRPPGRAHERQRSEQWQQCVIENTLSWPGRLSCSPAAPWRRTTRFRRRQR